ncbi:hypothetical protein NDU88_012037 [Pleurodeles waltl]|uniref:Uncharacterized protein n=1 Tax=Pleurodeles waltl TaxID=8319 RepID=A0AAV7S6M2_PLEWA|nr:hypothetical protein NDU88_012037 [Pleurodeles waltl]
MPAHGPSATCVAKDVHRTPGTIICYPFLYSGALLPPEAAMAVACLFTCGEGEGAGAGAILSRSLIPLLVVRDFCAIANYDTYEEEFGQEILFSYEESLVEALDSNVQLSVNKALAKALGPLTSHLKGFARQQGWMPSIVAPVETPPQPTTPSKGKSKAKKWVLSEAFERLSATVLDEHGYSNTRAQEPPSDNSEWAGSDSSQENSDSDQEEKPGPSKRKPLPVLVGQCSLAAVLWLIAFASALCQCLLASAPWQQLCS